MGSLRSQQNDDSNTSVEAGRQSDRPAQGGASGCSAGVHNT
jgi:hypothetical protein